MAKAQSKLKSGTYKAQALQPTERFYTIGYTPQAIGPNPRPQLTIKGCWLEAFGFTTGQPVIIDAQQGLLIIRIEGLS
ncbi:SymE family type I addiction module toxin [Snodgrassella sp. M0351]|uniref:SymE family type I addiction module toxin n=1 Tax=Snodgrassella sp. M0351 TaxID=2751012 RepID=UPI0018DD3248|nr:SymE family type I addiction module toxin [Snodgrassella sp. M0351]MBI0165721.1 type I toxin-antitoxin system SymE family toxin [Snodgrassella sp. M0351]